MLVLAIEFSRSSTDGSEAAPSGETARSTALGGTLPCSSCKGTQQRPLPMAEAGAFPQNGTEEDRPTSSDHGEAREPTNGGRCQEVGERVIDSGVHPHLNDMSRCLWCAP